MEKIPLAIVGCGGMGGRHLLGLKELHDSGCANVELAAVCDLRRDNAELLAGKAEALLGRRPWVFDDLGKLAAGLPELQGVDVATDAGAHHRVAVAAFDLGLHVFCEKPLALTIRGCNRILEAQAGSGRLLSVAENYRRDPMARLTKALLEAGAIGSPTMLFDVSAGAGNSIIILPWRHDKNVGGILLDGGVHNADMMRYYLGEVHQVFARARRWEPVRYKPASRTALSDFYAPWHDEMPASIEATAEDTLVSVIDFESGALGQWTAFYAAHGRGYGAGVIYGSRGSLRPGGIRNGASPVLHDDAGNEITGLPLLELVPGFHLDEITARLYGSDRLASYSLPFPEADRKLLAIEFHEFGRCVLEGRTPEVDGLVGRRDMALCYAAFEASVLNRPVTLAEIESGQTATYEAEINQHWKI
jgi:predicted dehydrogenase